MDIVLQEEDRQALARLEEAIWKEDTRFNMKFIEAALAPDFFEFGRSGEHPRGQTLAASRHFIDAKLPVPPFKIHLLDRDFAQVTYNSEVTYDGVVEHARRSSIWSHTETGWAPRFHQGTRYALVRHSAASSRHPSSGGESRESRLAFFSIANIDVLSVLSVWATVRLQLRRPRDSDVRAVFTGNFRSGRLLRRSLRHLAT